MFISANTALEADEEFVSDPVWTDRYDRIAGTVFSDVDGTLHVEHSFDEENWDGADTVAVSGDTPTVFSADLVGPYVRFRYKNGAGAQNEFRLYARNYDAGSS